MIHSSFWDTDAQRGDRREFKGDASGASPRPLTERMKRWRMKGRASGTMAASFWFHENSLILCSNSHQIRAIDAQAIKYAVKVFSSLRASENLIK